LIDQKFVGHTMALPIPDTLQSYLGHLTNIQYQTGPKYAILMADAVLGEGYQFLDFESLLRVFF